MAKRKSNVLNMMEKMDQMMGLVQSLKQELDSTKKEKEELQGKVLELAEKVNKKDKIKDLNQDFGSRPWQFYKMGRDKVIERDVFIDVQGMLG